MVGDEAHYRLMTSVGGGVGLAVGGSVHYCSVAEEFRRKEH